MFGLYEPLHSEVLIAGNLQLYPDYDFRGALALPKALLWRATGLAIESAIRFGCDLPVGASAGARFEKIGGIYASDNRTGHSDLHAERYALMLASAYKFKPEFLGVTLEPCEPCQSAISNCGVNTCYFVLSRDQVSDLGLINERPSILDGEEQTESPYFIQITDESLTTLNLTLLESVSRDRQSGVVEIDKDRLQHELGKLDFVEANRHLVF